MGHSLDRLELEVEIEQATSRRIKTDSSSTSIKERLVGDLKSLDSLVARISLGVANFSQFFQSYIFETFGPTFYIGRTV